jgi:hypothetical protein
MRTFYSILFIFTIVEAGFAQEIFTAEKSKKTPFYFGWENTPTRFSTEKLSFNTENSFSVFVEVEEISSAENLKFGLTGKQINSTSQWNHFSVMDDIREIQLLKSISPNSNYPFSNSYKENSACQPYPLIEVKVSDYLEIGL